MNNPEQQIAQSAQFIANRVKYKLVFLGNASVGKTSIIERYIFDIFDEKNQPTVGIDFIQKEIQLNERKVRLLLWDTAGQEKFQSLIPSYIRDASCALIVYDITRKSTFDAVENWYQQVKNTRGNEALVVLIGGTLNTLIYHREVQNSEAQEYAQKRNMIFYEISAKSGTGVNSMVESICQALPSETSLGITQSQCLKYINIIKTILVINQSQFEANGGTTRGEKNQQNISGVTQLQKNNTANNQKNQKTCC